MVISTGNSKLCTCVHNLDRPKVTSVDDPVGSWTVLQAWQADARLRLNWRYMVGLPIVNGQIEIRMHRGSGKKLRDSIGIEDSSAGLPEDARFEDRREFIIDPAVEQLSGRLGNAATAPPSDQSFGATQKRGQSATLKV